MFFLLSSFFFYSSVFAPAQVSLRSTELENTKLSAELQMLKAVELNREVTIAQFQEELERLRACVAQRDSLERELLAHKHDKVTPSVCHIVPGKKKKDQHMYACFFFCISFCCFQVELGRLREQLRQAEEQLQASRQQAALLASELRDSASARDHTMTELYRARIEADKLRASLADAQAECQRMESQLDRMRSAARKEVVGDGALENVHIGSRLNHTWSFLVSPIGSLCCRALGRAATEGTASWWCRRQRPSCRGRWRS